MKEGEVGKKLKYSSEQVIRAAGGSGGIGGREAYWLTLIVGGRCLT